MFFTIFLWEANFCCFSWRQVYLSWFIQLKMSKAIFQNIRKLYSGVTDVAIRSGNYMTAYQAVMCQLTWFSCVPLLIQLLSVYSCDTWQIHSLGPLSEVDEKNACWPFEVARGLDEVVLLWLQPILQFL